MAKLSIGDLADITARVRRATLLREGAGRAKITVHMGTCGIAAGARKVMAALIAELEKRDVDDVILTTSGCAGLCSREPMITVELQGQAPVKYGDVTAAGAQAIFAEHVMGGEIVEKHAIAAGSESQS